MYGWMDVFHNKWLICLSFSLTSQVRKDRYNRGGLYAEKKTQNYISVGHAIHMDHHQRHHHLGSRARLVAVKGVAADGRKGIYILLLRVHSAADMVVLF